MKRNLQIDFLRFCGVFLVMINHIIILGNSALDNILKVFKTGGWVGVDLFFVLSGYLVSGLIIKEYQTHGTFNAKRFLIRRGFKIYPSYYLFLGTAYFFFTYLTKDPQNKDSLFHEAVFISNYFSANNQHTWSISVEEHFYFLLSILFFFLIKFKKVKLKTFFYVYLLVFIVGLLCRLDNYLTYHNYDFGRDYIKSHYRFDALFFGVVLSLIANYRPSLLERLFAHKVNVFLLLLSVLFVATNFVFDRQSYPIISVVNLSLNPLCFGCILLNCIAFTNKMFLKLITPFAYIGKYSYSVYLFHTLCMALSIHIFKTGGITYYLFYFGTAIIGGIIISKLVEYPLIGVRERYFPSKSGKPKTEIEVK
ncbi:acyltransferase [Mucilaginibacter sp. HMF5004]|uniref:acyltransferase family protein n=1 Tax=Mucilaginibacter rivuli TaxID=2857527 RepID=UPI001C5F58BD|nr:acyltransferase [Mucilaginibacter rivuli]MBW4889873.1 acyltransferase [Mucilaginibacter rivuli]